MILTETYECQICGKKCRTDKLGYKQGMVSLWKYGSHEVGINIKHKGSILTCSHCLNAICKTIRKIIKDTK